MEGLAESSTTKRDFLIGFSIAILGVPLRES